MKEKEWIRSKKTGKFQYPISPNDKEKWAKLKTLDEKIDACEVPDTLLKELSTEELLELVLKYPLNINIFAYDTIQKGMRNVLKYHTGLEELIKRKDIEDTLFTQYQNEALGQENEEIKGLNFSGRKLLQVLLEELTVLEKEQQNKTLTVGPLVQISTPMGNAVDVHDQRAEQDFTDDEKIDAANDIFNTYQGVMIAGLATVKYNCHSYAWYKQSSDNYYWMNDPYNYADSYTFAGNIPTTFLQKVYYPDAGNEHSGVVFDSNGQMIISKWGRLCVVIHRWDNCPYTAQGANQLINYFN